MAGRFPHVYPHKMSNISDIFEAYKHRSPPPEESLEVERINMFNIRRLDANVKKIVHISSHVAVYTYAIDTSTGLGRWSEAKAAGSLLLYERFREPSHGIVIMNRIEIDNYNHLLPKSVEFEVSPPYLLFKDGEDIRCMWFYRESDCNNLAKIFHSLGHQVEIKSDYVTEKVQSREGPMDAKFSPINTGVVVSSSQSDGARIFQMLSQSVDRSQSKTAKPHQTVVEENVMDTAGSLLGYTSQQENSHEKPFNLAARANIVYTAPQVISKQYSRLAKKKVRNIVKRENESPILHPKAIKLSESKNAGTSQSILQQLSPQPPLGTAQISVNSGSSFVAVSNSADNEIDPVVCMKGIFEQMLLSPNVPAKTSISAPLELAGLPRQNVPFGMQTVEQLEKASAKIIHNELCELPSRGHEVKCDTSVSEYQLIESALKRALGLPQVKNRVRAVFSAQRCGHTSGSSGDNSGTSSNSGSLSPQGGSNVHLQSFQSTTGLDNDIIKTTAKKVEPDWVFRTQKFQSLDLMVKTMYPPKSNTVQSLPGKIDNNRVTRGVLTKQQLIESLLYLLKSDRAFGTRIYNAFLETKEEGLSD